MGIPTGVLAVNNRIQNPHPLKAFSIPIGIWLLYSVRNGENILTGSLRQGCFVNFPWISCKILTLISGIPTFSIFDKSSSANLEEDIKSMLSQNDRKVHKIVLYNKNRELDRIEKERQEEDPLVPPRALVKDEQSSKSNHTEKDGEKVF